MKDIGKIRLKKRLARKIRVRKKINGTALQPRVCVRRSLNHMVAQVIDDVSQKSLVQITTNSKEFQSKNSSLTKVEQSTELGKLVAEKTLALGIKKVVFDRGGFVYHGRVKAVADGARSAGLEI
jgi:large subunit ribosomal protein L18